MIDTQRWVLSEAWVASGLRMRLARNYEANDARTKDLLQGDARSYWYAGFGEWVVLDPDRGYQPFGSGNAPTMSTEDMRHELAHWITATDEQRNLVNFGMTKDSEDMERAAVAAEAVIASIAGAAGRIVGMALGAKR